MSRERAKILEMVAAGTISPEEAEKLMNRMEPKGLAVAVEDSPQDAPPRGDAPLKYLRVVVDGDDKINVRVPIGLIRTGIKLSTLMPLSASEHLTEHGIDLAQFNNLDSEELMEALRELTVDIDGDDGTVIRVFCE